MVRTEASKPRQRGERQPLRKMFIDVASDSPLLPCGEATSDLGHDAGRPAIEAHKLVHKDGAERLKIQPVSGPRIVNQAPELVDRVPQRCVFKEQPRGERYVGDAEL